MANDNASIDPCGNDNGDDNAAFTIRFISFPSFDYEDNSEFSQSRVVFLMMMIITMEYLYTLTMMLKSMMLILPMNPLQLARKNFVLTKNLAFAALYTVGHD